jgi:Skp family chaperone for outer membrane proteins
MKFGKTIGVVAAGAIAITLTSLVSQVPAQNAGGPRAVSIAVVDIEEVFNNLKEREAVQANIQGRVSDLQQWEQAKRREIVRLQEDLKVTNEGTEEYQQLLDQLRKSMIQLQVELELGKRTLEQESARQLEAIYRNIIDATGAIAKQQGYDVVLLRDKMPNLAGANQQQIAAMIQVRKLLYADQRLDITQQVKQRLNNEYQNR